MKQIKPTPCQAAATKVPFKHCILTDALKYPIDKQQINIEQFRTKQSRCTGDGVDV